MIRSFMAALSVLLLSVSLSWAQAPADATAPDAPAMWMVEDADNRVYLMGTVHLLAPDVSWRTDAMDAYLASADEIWFEADVFSAEATAGMQALIPQLGVNAPGLTLSSMISSSAQANLQIIAERLGAPYPALMQSLDSLQPWLANLQVAVALIQLEGFDPSSGVEQVLHAEWAERDGPMRFLETAEQQLRYIADLPLEVQLADFETALQEAVDKPEMLHQLVTAWTVGDMQTLDHLINDRMRADSPELYHNLIVVRNTNWASQIDTIMQGSDDAFIAVGAGHMPGDQGLVTLLEGRGYEVVRIQ